MYEFHYDYIKNKYGNNLRLSFTSTDILMHEIKTEDVYEDFNNDKEMFDFSSYSTKSQNVKMKDERAGVATEIVGLKPKMYLYLVDDNGEPKKEKTVNKKRLLRQKLCEYVANMKMLCGIRNVWGIQWIGFKVKIIE